MGNKLTAALSEAHKALQAYDSSLDKIKSLFEQAKSNDPDDYLIVEDKEIKSTWHLQVKRNGVPDHNLMGAAWAALHGGYRGNKYEGPKKTEAVRKLKALYKKEKLPLPSSEDASVQDPQDAQELNLTTITIGKNVSWDGMQGTVVQLYKRQISKVINDEPISIEGSPEDPAILIKDAAGNQFLRLASQVSLITQ